MKRILETAANVAILLNCLMVVWLVVSRQPAAGLRPGDSWSGPKLGHVLYLAVSPDCHYCTESMPFYRRLADAAGNPVKLVALVPDLSKGTDYVRSNHLGIPVTVASVRDLGLQGTPSLVLVGSAGRVRRVWVGKLSDNLEAQVFQVLKGEKSSD